MSRIVVDRIEGPYAVLEIAGHLVPVPVASLPPDLWDLREGEILQLARPAPEALPAPDAPTGPPADAPVPVDPVIGGPALVDPVIGGPALSPPATDAPEGIAPLAGSEPDGAAILAQLMAAHPQGVAVLDL